MKKVLPKKRNLAPIVAMTAGGRQPEGPGGEKRGMQRGKFTVAADKWV